MPTPHPPFRTAGVVRGPYFTDRAAEVARIARTLRTPGAKLTVFGERRMGKTSALLRAIELVHARGTRAAYCDLSTASSITDVANAVLAAATPVLHRRWKDIAIDLARRITLEATVSIDPATGLAIPRLSASLRSRPAAAQWDGLTRVLNTLDTLAGERRTHVALALDEFQRLNGMAGASAGAGTATPGAAGDALWRLRGIIQHHQHTAYVLAGSQRGIIEQALGKDGALYKLTEVLPLGPMDAGHLATWIDDRLTSHGVKAQGVGAACVALAGPRTLDVLQAAETCWDRCRSAKRAGPDDVAAAVAEIAGRESPMFERLWTQLTPLQQNVLRAIAAGSERLTSAETMERWALGNSSRTTQTLAALEERELVVRAEQGWGFDGPFFRYWVREKALNY